MKLNIFVSDGVYFVHRPKNEKLNPKHVSSTVKHVERNVLEWGCFSGYGKGSIHKIKGTMDRFMHQNILEQVMLLYAK